jgi:hypothetical protein
VQQELIFDKGFVGLLSTKDGGRMVATVCKGDCNLLLPRPTDVNQTQFWSSVDGGITWALVTTLPHVVIASGFFEEGLALQDSEDGYVLRSSVDGHELSTEEQRRIDKGSRAGHVTRYANGYVELTGEVEDGIIAGSFERPSEMALGAMSFLPGLLHADSGVVEMIGAPFGQRPFDRAVFISAVFRGPFWRVAGPDCLPLRAWADAFASVTACSAPGVLLRPTGGVRYEHGVEWREALMPNGTAGWVQRGSVEG